MTTVIDVIILEKYPVARIKSSRPPPSHRMRVTTQFYQTRWSTGSLQTTLTARSTAGVVAVVSDNVSHRFSSN
ncbi:MAG TPA: hypothetical protein DDZ51_19660 [Planctomycetaceae bacterium]|nr:hypothetical protein [Planctomycetaceae bacterium]